MPDGFRHADTFWAEQALLPSGWARNVRLRVVDGRLDEVVADAPAQPGDARLGVIVPGLGNVHSHAFQRAMAGLAEVAGPSGDDFWSWRALMYRFLDRLQPEDLEAIAAQAYMEMLESGFTRVGEFHYVHHQADGHAYADPAEMCRRLVAAAQQSGIGLTLLPVFYAHADFGGQPPAPAQRRMIHRLDGFARLYEGAGPAIAALDDGVLGLAPHSLRAVTGDELAALLPLTDGPLHIHIAEQQREVEACLAWSGQRPVQWLFEHIAVDRRWCLVHATHVNDAELRAIVASGAVVGLCPVTEANLGDGLFPMQAYARAGGRFAVGSDSNVRIDAAEELRLLEYGQRLVARGRNVLAGPLQSSGRWLYEHAGNGAAQALGVPAGLQEQAFADFLELELNHTSMVHRVEDSLLDSWLFAGRNCSLRAVWRRGRQLVHQGRHIHRDAISTRFSAAIARLQGHRAPQA